MKKNADHHHPQVGDRVGDQRERFPTVTVFGGDDAQRAVRRNVSLAFAKYTVPPTFVTQQISERIVRSPVPNPPNLNDASILVRFSSHGSVGSVT